MNYKEVIKLPNGESIPSPENGAPLTLGDVILMAVLQPAEKELTIEEMLHLHKIASKVTTEDRPTSEQIVALKGAIVRMRLSPYIAGEVIRILEE